ncbi:MAG: regulatory protein RecX [Nitrospirae bacterium]|nr:regulatory protein RecX [Nitrospirota bacterium]
MKDSRAEAIRYALKLLSYRSRSEKELNQKLRKKGFDEDTLSGAVIFLKDTEMVKDEHLAPELVRNAIDKRLLGKKGIQQFLSSRGIEKDLISESMSALSEDTEKETALRLVEKKMRILKDYPREVAKRRLIGMLQRRGFSSEVIHSAVKSINIIATD